MKKTENINDKLSTREVFLNNLYFWRLIQSSSPLLLGCSFAITALSALTTFISDVYLLRYALNGINEGKEYAQIVTPIFIWIIIYILIIGMSAWYNNYYYPSRITGVKRDIHHMVYQKATVVELSRYENPTYYDEFAKAIEECEKRIEAVISSLTTLLRRLFLFSANFALIVFIDPVLLLFVIIPLLAIPFQSKKNRMQYQKSMAKMEEKRREDYARRTFYLSDYAKEMRLTNMPFLMLKRFRESGERIVSIIQEYGFSIATLGYITTICNEVLTTLGATMYAAWQTFGTGRMGYGDCMIVVNSIENIAYTLTESANTLLKFQENALFIGNLRRFLEYKPTIVDGSKELPAEGDLVLENVSFRYEGAAHPTLDQVSMYFGRNEKVAIVGHNGAGKTTLVKLLLRLYDAEGSITYGGVDIREFPTEAYRNMFASVMQDFHIFALTVADNVLLRKRNKDDDKLIAEALENSGVLGKVSGFENGIDTIMTKEFDDKGVVLSGGEQQKLAISHIYSKKPRFVILDEPTSALDPIAEYEMYNRMMAACENCGMIFISHRLSSAVMADRIYLMEHGSVIESGTHAELMKNNGKYAEMFRRQAKNYGEV